jgi:hypothetical protein
MHILGSRVIARLLLQVGRTPGLFFSQLDAATATRGCSKLTLYGLVHTRYTFGVIVRVLINEGHNVSGHAGKVSTYWLSPHWWDRCITIACRMHRHSSAYEPFESYYHRKLSKETRQIPSAAPFDHDVLQRHLGSTDLVPSVK